MDHRAATAIEEPTGPWTRVGRFLRRVPRQERARSVVSAILEAAEEGLDLAEQGPLQPLFARAGVAAGSFYEYFSSRDALLSAVVERVTERNFQTFLEEIDAAIATDRTFEQAVRHSTDVIVAHYLRRPVQLRSVIRVADRLGLLTHVVRERDRFADAVALRTERFAPELSAAARSAMMRAAADAMTGVVVVSLSRAAPIEAVSLVAGDAAWGVVRAHLERAGTGAEQGHFAGPRSTMESPSHRTKDRPT